MLRVLLLPTLPLKGTHGIKTVMKFHRRCGSWLVKQRQRFSAPVKAPMASPVAFPASASAAPTSSSSRRCCGSRAAASLRGMRNAGRVEAGDAVNNEAAVARVQRHACGCNVGGVGALQVPALGRRAHGQVRTGDRAGPEALIA